jgi:hypothetical protein
MRGIAVELNKREVETPRGGAWHPQLVKRIVERLDAAVSEGANKQWMRLTTLSHPSQTGPKA